MLEKAGRSPGFMIGGVPLDLPGQVRPGTREVVTEGDEYDSAFFAKWPKFLSYRPDILIITSIEFDHADIYENIGEIEREFDRLVSLVPETGTVFVSTDSLSLQKLSGRWRETVKARLVTYGKGGELEVLERKPIGSGQELRLRLLNSEILLRTPLSGPQNAVNLLVAAGVGEQVGLSPEVLASGLSQFRGVLRRQTDHGIYGSAKLIEDFAHHPTAVALTLQGIRESNPGKRIIAAFEPRSNTTRRGFFQDEYPQSLSLADVVLMPEQKDEKVYSATSITAEPLNVLRMVERIQALGKEAHCFPDTQTLAEWIVRNRGADDVVVCMSNGDFGGLISRLKS
jgi:UDP-N-acetylmuramate: L-alanyl-gamma-D-glutamyl-meso-diaminopimelate ligase